MVIVVVAVVIATVVILLSSMIFVVVVMKVMDVVFCRLGKRCFISCGFAGFFLFFIIFLCIQLFIDYTVESNTKDNKI